jgi:hypothetical protein
LRGILGAYSAAPLSNVDRRSTGAKSHGQHLIGNWIVMQQHRSGSVYAYVVELNVNSNPSIRQALIGHYPANSPSCLYGDWRRSI